VRHEHYLDRQLEQHRQRRAQRDRLDARQPRPRAHPQPATPPYESSPGNVNFAKRYGRIGVQLTDTARARTTRIDHPPRGQDLSQSAYNPQLAADGRHVAFQAVRGSQTAQVFVCDLHTGSKTLASTGLPRPPRGTVTSIYEPRISADGSFVAFTAVTSRATGGPGATSSRVILRDLAAHITTAVSAGTPGFASDAALLGDGALVAFTAGQPVAQLYLRDVAAGTTRALTEPSAGAVVDPQLSDDGRTLAYTLVRGGRSSVEVRRLDTGATQRVASAKGSVTDPSLSADGAIVDFTSDAPDLSAEKADGTRGVFVRDLQTGTTTLASPPSTRARRRDPSPRPARPASAPPRHPSSASSTTPSCAATRRRRCPCAVGPPSPGAGAASPRTTSRCARGQSASAWRRGHAARSPGA